MQRILTFRLKFLPRNLQWNVSLYSNIGHLYTDILFLEYFGWLISLKSLCWAVMSHVAGYNLE